MDGTAVFRAAPVNYMKAHGLMGKKKLGAGPVTFLGLFPGSHPDAVSSLKAGQASAE